MAEARAEAERLATQRQLDALRELAGKVDGEPTVAGAWRASGSDSRFRIQADAKGRRFVMVR